MSEMNGGAGDGAVVFDITATTSGFESAIDSITRTLNGAASNWDVVIDAFAINMGLRISNAINEAVNEGIDLASSLEEISNRINVAFGEEGAKKVETWAKTVHDNYGISEIQAKNYVSMLGAMFSATGMEKGTALDYAMRLSERVGDIASLYDAEFDAVFRKARSGVSGIARPLYDYGVDLTKSTVSAAYAAANPEAVGWDSLSESEQQIARMDELFRQTDYLVGDFERTKDSYANLGKRSENAWQAFLTKVGEFFLPFKTNQQKVAVGLLESLAYGPTKERLLDPIASNISESSFNQWFIDSFGASTDSLIQSYREKAFEKLKSNMLDSFWMLAEEGQTGTLATVASAFLAEMNKQIDQGIEKGENMGKYERISGAYAKENFSKYSADELFSTIQYMTDILSQLYQITGTGQESQIFETIIQSIDQSAQSVSEAGEGAANSISDAGESVSSALSSAASRIRSISFPSVVGGGLVGGGLLNIIRGTYGSHANGLEYVPYDGYLAYLHQGERVMTAAEADLSRRYSFGSRQSFDYGAMGSAIGANMPDFNGMRVIWNGKVLGRVLAEQQADMYRTYERSGWAG